MISTNEGYTRLEYFSRDVAADRRRKEYDIKNHSLCHMERNTDFLFIGDSITEFWELRAYFGQEGKVYVNRGIAGDTTEYLAKRFYVDAVQLNPKYCILGIGINDSIELEGDYWKRLEPTPYDKILLAAKRNIEEVVQQARKAEIQIILTSLLPINIPILLQEQMRKRYIVEMNAWIQGMAADNNIIYINYYDAMIVPGTDIVMDGITYDGLHPNARGYEIMAKVLSNTLSKNQILI